MFAFALTLVLQASVQVEGLRDGERVVRTDKRPADSALFIEGRLLDAANSRPVAGATLEGWTEDFAVPAVLVDTAVSARDGTFRLRLRSGASATEKIRVRSAAHRGTTIAASDTYDEIMLVPRGADIDLRVLDFDDRPIAGVGVRTHQTCNHAPPAVEAGSDEHGAFVMPDMPPLADEPELEFSAPGFTSVHTEDLAWLAGASDTATVWLPQRAALKLRIFESDGTPAAGHRVVLGSTSGWQARFTSADGRVAFDSPCGEWRVPLFLRDRKPEEFLIEAWPSTDAEFVVRRGGAQYASANFATDARLVLDIGESDPRAPLLACHAQGWCIDQPGEHVLPPGRVRVMYGAPFSGWRAQIVEVELHAGERKALELRAQPEPRLHLRLPPETEWIVDVQAGDNSTRAECASTADIAVPPGVGLIVMARNEDEVRRAGRAGLVADGELSLADDDCVVQRARRDSGDVELRFACDPVPHTQARVRFGCGDVEIEADDSGALALTIPARTPFEAWFQAPGRVRACVTARAASGDVVPVRLLARSALVLRGRLVRAHAAGVDLQRAPDGNFVLADLAPGPLDAYVEREDGVTLQLEIALQPGETREFTVR